MEKKEEKARVSKTSLILWHAHQNDVVAVRKLLEVEPWTVHARDDDNRTLLHGWTDVSRTDQMEELILILSLRKKKVEFGRKKRPNGLEEIYQIKNDIV